MCVILGTGFGPYEEDSKAPLWLISCDMDEKV